MELQNCRSCKKLFNYITGEKICPICKDLLEKKFEEVKAYVRENPGTHIDKVASECDTTIKQIKKWVREERLVFSDDSLVGLECERCGKLIHSGKYCRDCAGGLSDAMEEAFRKQVFATKRGSTPGKMHFLD